MKAFTRCSSASILGIFSCASAATQPPQPEFAIEWPISPPGGTPQVIGGVPTQPDLWPATLILRGGPASGCTVTVVGDHVVLLAAHCVNAHSAGVIKFRSGQPGSIVCDVHPAYKEDQQPTVPVNQTKDFSLCLSTRAFEGFPFERIGTSIADGRLHEQIRLLGYGCTLDRGVDHKFGVLFTGTTKVDQVPTSADDVYTVAKGEGALCYGDSGGGAYADPDVNNRRSLIGVNSKGNFSDTSFLSTTATETFINWALAWSQAMKANICGLHASAQNCR